MNRQLHRRSRSAANTLLAGAAIALGSLGAGQSAQAQGNSDFFKPGNLVVSRSVYDLTNPAFGGYPTVWNQVLIDPSFGITSRILLDQITPGGTLINSLEIPNSTQHGVPPQKDQMVTSFSSKSEMALNLSTDGQQLSLMGYLAPVDAVDVSNANTPLAFDPTDPVTGFAYRVVAQVDGKGKFRFTITNAYSGNNGRAAILHNTDGANAFFTVGNAGNGSNPQPDGIIIGTGVQFIPAETKAIAGQKPDLPTPLGSFGITELPGVLALDKVGKDDNFRGLTIFNNVVYVSKGSGSNGVNTVYFIDTWGGACPSGTGVPHAGAALPSGPIAYDASQVHTNGLPNNMCILNGFPSALNSALKKKTTAYPFGLWFANDTTLYVADEGDGAFADAAPPPISASSTLRPGLQKWVFDKSSGAWKLAYTLQAGLGLGSTYSFPGDAQYPLGINDATGLNWAPLTAGLRNITGRVNGDGTVTIWGVTSTVSGVGDVGADPNRLVTVTDNVSSTGPNPPAGESFVLVRSAAYGEVLRGVSFTPGASAP